MSNAGPMIYPKQKKHFDPFGPSWMGALLLPFILFITMFILHQYTDSGIFDPTVYNTYTRQAMAWREGLLHLPQDVPSLELAVYNGEYYVSFPPVPSLVLLPLTYIFGMDTPDHFLQIVYMILAAECIYCAMLRNRVDTLSAFLYTLFVTLGSCILAIATSGAVWFHAQVLGFALMAAAYLFYSYDRLTLAMILFALSVGCRPFNAIYGMVLGGIWIYERIKEKTAFHVCLMKVLPGLLAGLLIACAYGAYNYARFGDIFEFGHNYLPQFSWQGGIQFSTEHISKNIKTFVFTLPFEKQGDTLSLRIFGFSMLIASPVYICMLVYSIKDIVSRKMTVAKVLILFGFFAQLFLLLMHRTFGGYQFGARYTCDLLVYAVIYFSTSRKRISRTQIVLCMAAIAFSLYGAFSVSLT